MRGLEGDWRLARTVRYRYGQSESLPEEVLISAVGERSGEIETRSVRVTQDGSGRVAWLKDGGQVLEYEYNAVGDVVRIVREEPGFETQATALEHGEVWNPFFDFPLFHGTHQGIFAPDAFSRHLSDTYANYVAGSGTAASVGTAAIVRNSEGYPLRRTWAIRNASDPDVEIVIVTEYEYRSAS